MYFRERDTIQNYPFNLLFVLFIFLQFICLTFNLKQVMVIIKPASTISIMLYVLKNNKTGYTYLDLLYIDSFVIYYLCSL
jgi:hypothetical protein